MPNPFKIAIWTDKEPLFSYSLPITTHLFIGSPPPRPSNYDAIAKLQSNISFCNPKWLECVELAVQYRAVIQPFQRILFCDAFGATSAPELGRVASSQLESHTPTIGRAAIVSNNNWILAPNLLNVPVEDYESHGWTCIPGDILCMA